MKPRERERERETEERQEYLIQWDNMQIFKVWVGITFFCSEYRSLYIKKKNQLIKSLETRHLAWNHETETAIYWFYFQG